MNEKDGKTEENRREEEGGYTHSPVPIVNAAESEQSEPKDTGQGEETTPLHQITQWERSKQWFSEITVAEAGMFLLTLVIAGSSVYYAIYAKRQWKVLRDQLPELQTSAQAAKDAARAARDAVDQATASSHLDQRSWLAIIPEPIVFKPTDPDVDPRVSATVNVKNTGRTPARNLKGWIRLQNIWSINREKPDFFKQTTDDTIIDIPTISPGDSAPFRVFGKRYMDPDRLREDSYINGELQYCDVFNERHFVNFCFQEWWTANPDGHRPIQGMQGCSR